MQNTTRLAKTVRTALVSGSLLAALAFGSVAADSNDIGLTECDHGCGIALLSGASDDVAAFQVVSAAPASTSAYVSEGPGDIGFTR